MRLLKPMCILSSLLGFVFLTSCAPRVMTNLVKTYPSIVPPDSVVVIEVGETVPNSAETIGRVTVIDGGFSTKCRYDQVLRIAQEETAKAGGNGLAITTHLEPSVFVSSCRNQISALILRLKDLEIDPLKSNPVQDAIDLNLSVARERRAKRIPPANVFDISLGYGFITSKVYDLYNQEVGKKNGLEWKLEYEHVWKSGWAVGAQYSGFRVAYPGGNMVLSYFVPQWIYRAKFNQWMFKVGLGLGAFVYHEPGYTAVGLGSNTMLGLEYMLSESVGLGVTMNTVSGSLPERESYHLKEGERSGVARINFLGGVRFYF